MHRQLHIPRPFLRSILTLVLLAFISCVLPNANAQEPERYALLIAVTTYRHAEMNKPQLEYPEVDAEAVGKFLTKHGYTVEYLLGTKATQSAIKTKLESLADKGNQPGVVFVGLWGHGVEFDGSDEAMFCPYDSKIRFAVDSRGNKLFNENGSDKLVEPNPKSLVGMSEILGGLQLSGAGNRLLIADCCRSSPNRPRGRAFGSNVKLSDLPDNTAAIFACQANEQAFEDKRWGHGAMTKALLDLLPGMVARQESGVASILGPLKRDVMQLVADASRGRDRQTISPILKGLPDLSFRPTESPNTITNSIGMKFQLIPAGEFMMGSKNSVENLAKIFDATASDFADEHPRHRVRLTQDFYLGTYEVTVGQFRKFVESTGYRTEAETDGKGGAGLNLELRKWENNPKWNWGSPGYQQSDNHPVSNVSWNDAVAFCKWLSRIEKVDYRLPTEAQWEYACRARSTTLFHHGDSPEGLAFVGNIADPSLAAVIDFGGIQTKDGSIFSSVVGKYKPNAFGLHDMHGNVFEHCSDWYGKGYYADSVENDPQGPSTGTYRVIRGGNWNAIPNYCRSANREIATLTDRSCSMGFRVARNSNK